MTFKEKVNEMKIHHEEHKEERHERHEEKKFAHEIKHQMKEEERLKKHEDYYTAYMCCDMQMNHPCVKRVLTKLKDQWKQASFFFLIFSTCIVYSIWIICVNICDLVLQKYCL